MSRIRWKTDKIYVDGHQWAERDTTEPPNLEKMFEEPGLVGVVVTRQSMRKTEDDDD